MLNQEHIDKNSIRWRWNNVVIFNVEFHNLGNVDTTLRMSISKELKVIITDNETKSVKTIYY